MTEKLDVINLVEPTRLVYRRPFQTRKYQPNDEAANIFQLAEQ